MEEFEAGHVWIAGAGPGDVDLLTLAAAHGLKHADVVMHDALVSDDILALANSDAKMEFAGKRAGQKSSLNQDDINARMIAHARGGKRVLRLKGGDPFVFARGGEEACALKAADVRYRIIPGITAGLGGLACAGIPATHRKINNVVSFVTGRDLTKCLPANVDWGALAASSPVIVLYMAIKTMPEIAQKLIAAGRDKNEPCAIISNATLQNQKVVRTTLSKVGKIAAVQPSPAIIVVGQVAGLAG